MDREIEILLAAWRDASADRRKPLIIRGARQTGKTWVVRKLGEQFQTFVELNFEENPELGEFFDADLDPFVLVTNLSNYLDRPIAPQQTLLFLDEIQACPRAITALRYFYEKLPQLHVIAAGSLLEFELDRIGVPVGRVQFAHMTPMSFGEFLNAIGKESLRQQVREQPFKQLPRPLHNQLLQLVRDYIFVGGMPEVVARYREDRDLRACQVVLSNLLESYRADFPKYAKLRQVQYVREVFDAIPHQLGSKFKYSRVSTNLRSRELAPALGLLCRAHVVYQVFHSSGNGHPLAGEKNAKKFKVLFLDTGLCQRLLGVDIAPAIISPGKILTNYGPLVELFVGLQLLYHARRNNPMQTDLYYWHRESRSKAEVDYLVANTKHVFPIEVKSGKTGTLKSLHLFIQEKWLDVGYQFSGAFPSKVGTIQTVPLYAVEGFVETQWKPRHE